MTNHMIFHPVPVLSTCVSGASTPATLNDQVQRCMSRYVYEREAAIHKLREDKPELDYMSASVYYDMNAAPLTTNHDMLVFGCGITIVPPLSIQQDLDEHITHLANALAAFNIYFLNHSHLSDKDLYALMWKATQEEIRFLPPSEGVSEYIDLSSAPWSDKPNPARVLPSSHDEVSWEDTKILPITNKESNHD